MSCAYPDAHDREEAFPTTVAGALTCLPRHRLMMSSGRFQVSSSVTGRGRAGAPHHRRSINTRARVNINILERRADGPGGDDTAVSTHTVDVRDAGKMNKHAHTVRDTHTYTPAEPQACLWIKPQLGQPLCPWQHSLFQSSVFP